MPCYMPPLADDGMSGTNPSWNIRHIRHIRHRHRHPPLATHVSRVTAGSSHRLTIPGLAFPIQQRLGQWSKSASIPYHILYTTHSSTTLHTHYIHHQPTSCQTPFRRVTTMVSVPCSNPGYHSHPASTFGSLTSMEYNPTGIREEIKKVLKQDGYDDGELEF
jgi:hypothetical protein